MIQNGHKTSLLVPSQLPEFIRDNDSYANFVAFIQAYYEWMEQDGNVIDQSQNIPNYIDVDYTTQEFLNYFSNDFLQYFPPEILADKRKVIKIAKELYETKGSEASFRLLFRILYNSDVDFFYTKDVVLKASAGKWYVPKSLLLVDMEYLEGYINPGEDWLGVQQLRIFGETSKSIATIENSVMKNQKVEVFISNIERLFQSGEIVRLVDANNQDILDEDGGPIRAKLVGQIGQIILNPNSRGLAYKSGDPVVVYGGLSANNGLGAVAQVGVTTTGSLRGVTVNDGGYGYTLGTLIDNPLIANTQMVLSQPDGGAILRVGALNQQAANAVANVAFIPEDYIGSKTSGNIISIGQGTSIGATNYFFANIATSNANTTLANAFTFTAFQTFPISTVFVDNGGGGLSVAPDISAVSLYPTLTGAPRKGDLGNLGILAPIQILNGGVNYTNNDTIIIQGGSGYGANAKITVNSAGSIVFANYVAYGTGPSVHYPIGGMGYKLGQLPTIIIKSTNSANANASLVVPGVLGRGASFKASTTRVGEIQTINVLDYGEDYVSAPTVSLKVQDLQITGLSTGVQPVLGDIIYQGTSLANSTYSATVNQITNLQLNGIDTLSVWNLRVIDYTSLPNYNLSFNVVGKPSITFKLTTLLNSSLNRYDSTGVITYGDGTATATATFLNGLSIGSGQYLDTTGQPSSFDVLQSTVFNNYTYEITVDKEIAKYRDILLNLLHPTGMQAIGRFRMRSANNYAFHAYSAIAIDQTLFHYTGQGGSSLTMNASFTNPSNNIITFSNLGPGVNIATIIATNNTIRFTTANNDVYAFGVASIKDANTIVVDSNTWLAFANVAVATSNAGSNVINITSLTGSYDIVNNGNYSNTSYPLKDIIRAGDTVKVNNMTQTVSSVDYINNKLYLNDNLTYSSNGFLSSSRTLTATALNIRIFGSIGTQYYSGITTESGSSIITENGNIILIG
jgi:3-dehydroquinate dehydratase